MDASDVSNGAVLSQKDDQGIEHPLHTSVESISTGELDMPLVKKSAFPS